MNRDSLGWIAGAVVVLGLAAFALVLGRNLLPPSEVMQSKLNTIAPLIITWGMIWITIIIALALAGFLLATGLSKARHSEGN
jgi:hypothetical protein